MKKLSILFTLLALAFTGVLTSCDKLDDTGASDITITLTPADAVDKVVGETQTYTIALASPTQNIKSLEIAANPDVDGELLSVTPTDAIADLTAFTGEGVVEFDKNYQAITLTFKVTIPDDGSLVAGNKVTLTFTATDKKDNTKSGSATINIVEDEPELSVTSYNNVTLNYNSTSLAATSMFNADNGNTLAANGTAADMDLALCWQNSGGYSIVAPNAAWLASLYAANSITYNTAGKNATKIQKLTATWASLDAAAIDALTVTTGTVVSPGGNGVNNLANGDVLAFETAEGKKGVIQVNISAKKDVMVEKSVTINVKVLNEASAK